MSTVVTPPVEETPSEQPQVVRGGDLSKKPKKPKEEHPVVKKLYRVLRLIKYFILSGLIITIMEIWLAYWLLSSRWHLLLSNEEMVEYASYVNEAEPMPANFMDVYTAIFPNHVHTSLKQQIFVNYGSRFFFRHTEIEDKPHCMCDMVYDIQKLQHAELDAVEWDGRLQDLEYGFGIEKYSTPENCFNFVMQYRVHELLDRLSSKHYGHLKNKSIAEMSDDELCEVILLLRPSWHINRYRKPERFQKALEYYKERMRTHRALANNQ